MFHVKHRNPLLLILTAGLLWSSCTVGRNPVTGRKRAYGYTWEQERQLGADADKQIMTQFGLYDDPELQAYVEKVAQRVLAESHLRRADAEQRFKDTPFTFRVLDSEVVNAFALPGGFVYVTRGLLTHLENEAQLGVVIAHEIGHVAARHGSKQAAEQQLGQFGLLGGAVLGGAVLGGNAAQNILQLGSQASQLLFLSYSRDDERESDKLGVEYASMAGYDAGQAAAFFDVLDRISAQAGARIPSWQSTHPDPGEREQTIRKLDQLWETRVTGATEVDQDQYLRHIDGVVMGANPRQGFVENNTFYHPELKFQFPVPSGFQVQNEPSQVVLFPQAQDGYQVFSLAQNASASDAASQFASQEGIRVVEQNSTSVNGMTARSVLATAQQQDGSSIAALAYFIEYGGQVYTFLGVTPEANYNKYRDEFRRAATGFRPLTDRSILNVQPTRVNVVPASRTAAFQTFVSSNLPRNTSAQDLAIMNGVELGTTIQKGTLLKLPQ